MDTLNYTGSNTEPWLIEEGEFYRDEEEEIL